MCEDCEIGDIAGVERLIEWFGERPCFHDAEVVEVQLVRNGRSHVMVHAWKTHYKQVDDDGHCLQDHHAVIDFCFEKVTDLNLTEFSQNVIFSLQVLRTNETSRIVLEPCYGLSGFIEGIGLSVNLIPGKPGTFVESARESNPTPRLGPASPLNDNGP